MFNSDCKHSNNLQISLCNSDIVRKVITKEFIIKLEELSCPNMSLAVLFTKGKA